MQSKKTLDFILDKYGVRGKKSPIYLHCSRKVTLPRLINQLGFFAGAEVGVARGHNAANMCARAPYLKLYAIDAWKPYFGCTHGETDESFERVYKTAVWRLKPYNVEIIRDWSEHAAGTFADNILDFVFIDAAHDYDNVTKDIKLWSKKVRPGGIIAGHDYCDPNPDRKLGYYEEIYNVKKAVDDWVKAHKIKPLFILDKGSGGDLAPTWFWVKGKNG